MGFDFFRLQRGRTNFYTTWVHQRCEGLWERENLWALVWLDASTKKIKNKSEKADSVDWISERDAISLESFEKKEGWFLFFLLKKMKLLRCDWEWWKWVVASFATCWKDSSAKLIIQPNDIISAISYGHSSNVNFWGQNIIFLKNIIWLLGVCNFGFACFIRIF